MPLKQPWKRLQHRIKSFRTNLPNAYEIFLWDRYKKTGASDGSWIVHQREAVWNSVVLQCAKDHDDKQLKLKINSTNHGYMMVKSRNGSLRWKQPFIQELYFSGAELHQMLDFAGLAPNQCQESWASYVTRAKMTKSSKNTFQNRFETRPPELLELISCTNLSLTKP